MKNKKIKLHPNTKDITGNRFGRLIVTSFAYRNKRGTYWNCICDCGNHKNNIFGQNLRAGWTKSCGCLLKEQRLALVKNGILTTFKHGASVVGKVWPEYTAWQNMIRRCTDPTNKAFKNYGGRGIKVCKRWKNSFRAFFKDMGRKHSPAHSLDRIKNHKGYKPGNCRWATYETQANNRRKTEVIRDRKGRILGRLPSTET